jgi:hypothetical protein
VEGLSAAEAEARLAAALPAAGAQHDREPDAEHEDFEANE